MEFHEIIAIIVTGIAFILFGIVVRISCRHHNAINKLNSTLSSLGSTERIAIDVRDINLSVRIIAYIALAFCLGVVIHYLAIALPRIYEDKPLQNLGVDYLGLIVAIFAIIVTLLVTWQIFSTIKAKEELKEIRREIKSDFESKIKDLDTRLTALSTQQARTEGRVEEKQQPNQSISLALPPEILEFSLAKMAKETSPLYNWLLGIIDGVKTTADIMNEYSKVLKKSPNKVKYINGRFATKEEIEILIKEVEPIALMRLNAIK